MRNKIFLRGTQFYIDEYLTLLQLEERRKEWEKFIEARNVGKEAWMYRWKA